ncbi:hypothetical protein COCSUDRAFT_58873 [Coccomyxa subellipsoidea C-169]|uniref:Phytocyanin domain-containing protein n=1 Tax=Coccomyxa subellipsoidea (strain C-169) TaxID=574566 RepID=I0Z6R7_COCSC|nr:hypothetical protein COCSUDRAFT_58873 [Coccomyxa subellipsoidea C-169]EIE26336.1 hypothetical protein COCSUDRAFT_58873 [Coccomyxa subellipsoidea C-169]|eukprot:XP_005650880.1 hypothetical protein COCSUDRAFT_58873 [Coccomyxa subellipsoidea C-169]
MKTWCVTAVLLLCVGISVGRQLQQGSTPSSGGNTATAQATATATASVGGGQIYAIDPWSLGKSYAPLTVAASSRIRFNWNSRHGVYRIPSGSCPSSFSPGNGIIALAPASNGGSFTTPPLSPGVYWYACPVPTHCPSGMIFKVTVV